MVLSSTPFAHEIDFSTGFPTGAVVYSLLGNDGLPMAGYDDISVSPDPGAISILIVIPATANVCALPLFESRTLVWSYTTDSGLINGRVRYRVEADIPFPVSPEGVRAKLGVEPHEITDNEIDLLLAYGVFASNFDPADLEAYESTGGLEELRITNAIEAIAALNKLPALRLAIAQSEDSGTNRYDRFKDIDWDALQAGLNAQISEGIQILIPLDDELTGGIIFFTVQRSDPLTGA